mmetsp:Transcript_54097/g.144925  ORF Transcript_54097/g.144925 Transcript_54097/m.144925 type:complete len:201 (+) Transcript_54097:294-896(+)
MDDHPVGGLKLLRQDSQLAFNPTAKLLVHLLGVGKNFEPQEVPEVGEVGERVVDLAPCGLVRLHALYHLVASSELIEEDALGRLSDIVGGVHCRESGCDHRHEVLPVCGVQLGVPDLKSLQAWFFLRLLDLAQHDRLRPIPLVVDPKEAVHQLARCVVGVELADARYEQCPSDAPEEAEHVRIDPPPPGPTLDEAQRLPE